MTVMNLDQLDVWTLSRDFAVMIYKKVILPLFQAPYPTREPTDKD